MILLLMMANPESFESLRELILACPDLDGFVSRPVNFRAGHYHFVSSPWCGNDYERKEALGHYFWIWSLKKMSFLWPSITMLSVQKGWTREEWGRLCPCLHASELMLAGGCLKKKKNSSLTADCYPFWFYGAKHGSEFVPSARPPN